MTDADVGNGVRLHYRRIGAGEPLLLAMGTAASLGMWMPVETALAGSTVTSPASFRIPFWFQSQKTVIESPLKKFEVVTVIEAVPVWLTDAALLVKFS